MKSKSLEEVKLESKGNLRTYNIGVPKYNNIKNIVLFKPFTEEKILIKDSCLINGSYLNKQDVTSIEVYALNGDIVKKNKEHLEFEFTYVVRTESENFNLYIPCDFEFVENVKEQINNHLIYNYKRYNVNLNGTLKDGTQLKSIDLYLLQNIEKTHLGEKVENLLIQIRELDIEIGKETLIKMLEHFEITSK